MSNFEHGLGLIRGEADPRDYVYGVSTAALPAEYLPQVKAKVHNQGQINNCATHALTASLENVLGGTYAFGWNYGNRRYSEHKGQGTVERDLLKAAQKDGCLIWAKYPFEEEMTAAMERFEASADPLLPTARRLTIGNYWQLPTFDSVRLALVDGMHVQLGLQLFAGIKKVTAQNPVLREPVINRDGSMEEWLGGHMVWATGYCVRDGVRCIRCRNSWGADWGENGDFYVPENYFTWSQRKGFPIPSAEPWAFELGKPQPEKTGWYKQDGKWRYSKDGKDSTGWILDKGTWYYLDPDGFMVADDWRLIDQHRYYLTSTGAMARSWRKISGMWYYFNTVSNADGPNGSMLTGMHEIGGKRYYLNEDDTCGIPIGALIITDENGAVVVS